MTSRQSRLMDRPIPLILIAVFQLSKATFFLFVAGMILIDPQAAIHSPYHFSWFVDFVSADGSAMIPIATALLRGHNPSVMSIPVVAAVLCFLGFWLVYISWGLWQLKAWARRTRVGVSILQVISGISVLLAYYPADWAQQSHAPLTPPQWRDLFILVWLNAAIIFYLVRDVDVDRAFAQQAPSNAR